MLINKLNNKLLSITDNYLKANNIPSNKRGEYIISISQRYFNNPTFFKTSDLRQVNRKFIKFLKENYISLFQNKTNPYSTDDYRHHLFTPLKKDEVEFFFNRLKENYTYDFMLYFSQYGIDNEKWEDRVNKACNLRINASDLATRLMVLNSPFIRANSKNLLSISVIDIDFPEVKEYNDKEKKDFLLTKAKKLKEFFSNCPYKEFIPNYITFTRKGFQLIYFFDIKLFGTHKRDKLIIPYYTTVYFDEEEKKVVKSISFSYSEITKNKVLRDNADKLKSFYNATIGFVENALVALFGGDAYATQSFAQGRVIRNPLVNASVCLSTEVKNIQTMKENIANFSNYCLNNRASLFPKKEHNEQKKFFKYKKNEELIQKMLYTQAQKIKTIDDLNAFPICIPLKKEEAKEIFADYTYSSIEEEKIVNTAILTYELPIINFKNTKKEGYRNNFIFHYIRFFAYKEKTNNYKITEDELYNKLLVLAHFINNNLQNPLDNEEVDIIAGSVTYFTIKRYNGSANVKKNRKIAQRKSLKTKIQFVKELFNYSITPVITLKNKTQKELAKIGKISERTIRRWLKTNPKLFKELISIFIASIKNKSFETVKNLLTNAFIPKDKLAKIYSQTELEENILIDRTFIYLYIFAKVSIYSPPYLARLILV